MPCRTTIDRKDATFTGYVLDTGGDRRFQAKAADSAGHLVHGEAAQVLYQGIMAALGYTKNKVPMLELAGRLPLSRLVKVTPATIPDDECLVRYQALLLGTAGLLPPRRNDRCCGDDISGAWVERLESAWAAFGEAPAMSAGDWNSFKVRPGNSPRRRLAAMSYLLVRYRKQGLLEGLMSALDKNPEAHEEPLVIDAQDYWAENLDFGLPVRQTVPALLGEDRAAVIVVNVLLPFAAAWGESAACPELAEKAREIYRSCPAPAENTLERHKRRQLGISRFLVNTARRQQGLLHIFKTLCSQGKCPVCPLS